MNKTSPFLQEIEEVPVASDAPTQEPEVIEGTSEGAIDDNAALEIQKNICQDTPGFVWNSETNTCEKEIEELDPSALEGTPLEPETITPAENIVYEQQYTGFGDIVEHATQNYRKHDRFNPETDFGKVFFKLAQDVYVNFKANYPDYDIGIHDIENFIAYTPEVIEDNFNIDEHVEYVAKRYFRNIINVVEYEGYKDKNLMSGDPEEDFKAWSDCCCEFKNKKKCRVKWDQYIGWRESGKFDAGLASEKIINQAKENFVLTTQRNIYKDLEKEQQILLTLLEGVEAGGIKPTDPLELPTVEVEKTYANLYYEKFKIIENNGYNDVKAVITWDPKKGPLSRGINEGKVQDMIRAIVHPSVEFGDDDDQFKITQKVIGEDILLLQKQVGKSGGRLSLELNLESLTSGDPGFDIVQQRWEKMLRKIVSFYTNSDIEEHWDIIMLGGKYDGLGILDIEKKKKWDKFVSKEAAITGFPTDIIRDAYNETGEKIYSYEPGTKSIPDPTRGLFDAGSRIDVPIFVRRNILTNELTEVEDPELLGDLHFLHAWNQKQKLSSEPRHNWLYPAEFPTTWSNKDYGNKNSVFISGTNEDGTFQMNDMDKIARILGKKYSNFDFTFPGGVSLDKMIGIITVTHKESGRSIKISLADTSYNLYGKTSEYNIKGIEKFKLDLIGFIDQNSKTDIFDYSTIELQKHHRRKIFNDFYGDGGIATSWTSEQEVELKELESELNENIEDYLVFSRVDEFGLGQSEEGYYKADPEKNKYVAEINQAISTLKSMGIKNPTPSMIGPVAIELILKGKKNSFMEENIGDWWKEGNWQNNLIFFKDKTKEEAMEEVKLAGIEYATNLEKEIVDAGGRLAILETTLENSPDLARFSEFYRILQSEDENDLFIPQGTPVTQEDIDSGRILALKNLRGGIKFIPADYYAQIVAAGASVRLLNEAILKETDAISKKLEKVTDLATYNKLVSKSYAWGDYLKTKGMGVTMGFYKVMAAAYSNVPGAQDKFRELYADLKTWQSGTSKEAKMYSIEDGGALPWNWPGFGLEFIIEQSESFSQFGFGIAVGTALAGPVGGMKLGPLIGAGLTGMSTYSGNYLDRQLEHLNKHGNLNHFDPDESFFYESLAIGGVNFLSAYISGRYLTHAFKFFKSAIPSGAQRNIWIENLKSYAGFTAPFAVGDAALEALTEITENIIRGEEIDWDAAKEIFFQTALFNMMLPITGLGISGVMQTMSNYDGGANTLWRDNMRKINELALKANDLAKKLDQKGTEITGQTAQNFKQQLDEILGEIEGLQKQNADAAKEIWEKMSDMDKSAWTVLMGLGNENKQIENKIQDIKNDKELSLKEKRERIEKLEDKYRQNKKFLKKFMNSDNIENQLSVLKKKAENKENVDDIALLDRVIKGAKEKLKEDGKTDPTEDEINKTASVIYNSILITENFNKSPKRTSLSKRTKLAQTKDDAYTLINDFYDGEINRLSELDPESTMTFAGVKNVKVRDIITELKKSKAKQIGEIKKGNHGVSINYQGIGGKRINITVVENAAADDRTQNKTHEVGHDVFVELFGGNPETYSALSNTVEEYLKSSYPELWAMAQVSVEKQQNGEFVQDELVMRFLEFVAEGKIDLNNKKGKIFSSLFTYFGSQAVEAQTGVEFNFDIKGSDGAIHFLKTLAIKIRDGQITKEDINNIKKSGMVERLMTKAGEDVKKIDFSQKMSVVKAGMVNDVYEEKGVDGAFDIIELYGGMIRLAANKYANIPGVDYDVLEGFMSDIGISDRGLYGLIQDYPDYVKKQKELGLPVAPLSGFINKWLGVRVDDVAQQNQSIRDAIAGIGVAPMPDDMVNIPDDSNTSDSLFDENNNNIEEQTGEVRKIFGIEENGELYNKVVQLAKDIAPELTTDEALSNPKNQKKYRQDLERIFTAELTTELNGIFNDRTKFETFLREHQDVIMKLIAIKYKNKFKDLSVAVDRADVETSRDVDNYILNPEAGNTVWQLKKLSPDEFVAYFMEGRNAWETRRKSLQKSLAAELGLDAVFTAMPANFDNKLGKIAEAIKRDPNVKFSASNGQVYNFHYAKNSDGTVDSKKVSQDIRDLAKLFKNREDFFKYVDLETMKIAGHPEFNPAVVAFVYDYAHNPELDASSQMFKSNLVKKNKNFLIKDELNPQVQAFLDIKNFRHNEDAQQDHVKEVANVVMKYTNGNVWVYLKGRGYGFYRRGMNASETIHNPNGKRKDGAKIKDNKSHSGATPLMVEGWTFNYDATVTVDGVEYTGAFEGVVNGEKVTSLDPVGDPSIKAKLKSSPHYNSKKNIGDNLNMDYDGGFDINWENVSVINPDVSGGIMKKLEDIMWASEEEMGAYGSPERLTNQQKAVAGLQGEINGINEANAKVHASMNMGWFDAMIEGDASLTGFLQFLQLQSSDTMGLKGMSQIHGVTFPLESKKEGDRAYGEHLVVNTETSGKLADLAARSLLFDENGKIIGYKEGYDRDIVKAELLKIARQNVQILVPESYAKKMDEGPGKKTSTAGMNRINFLDNSQLATLYSVIDPNLSLTEQNVETAITENVDVVTEEINQENQKIQIKNEGLADIYTKNSKGVETKSMIADFDETMWIGGDNVIVATNPKTGETIDIASEDFHKVVDKYKKDGWTFNFDDFVLVKGGKRGPYFDRAVRFIKEEGLDGFRVLTARQPEAAVAIAHTLHSELLKENITEYSVEDIIEKITGLGVIDPKTGETVVVTGPMKAKWILDNIISNGFTKVEFADDGTANVVATEEMFNDLPPGVVEGTSILVTPEFKDTHAKFSEKTNSDTFNIFIEETSGVDATKVYSNAVAKIKGAKPVHGNYNNIIPYSAEDFRGLLYQFLGKGEMGEYQMAWFKEKLIDPYSRGELRLKEKSVKINGQYKGLIKGTPGIKKKLKSKVFDGERETNFNVNNAIRVYLWHKNGLADAKKLGLSDRDFKALISTVESDKKLLSFANQLSAISGLKQGYVTPGEYWLSGSIMSDIRTISGQYNRETELSEFLKNADEIFSEENLNKIEVVHGAKFRLALENMLARMKTGRSDAGFNRQKDPITKSWDEWVNDSVGAIMFLNGRSAVLQTISAFNYVKLTGPNNPMNASMAFANQAQFWKDFKMLWNSPYLLKRREGDERGINEAELAEHAKKGGPRAVISYLLKIGFTPTRLADSFAIASGGAVYVRNYANFYENQINEATGELYTPEEALNLAMENWALETETGQQSSRQDMLSQEQTGGMGRLILAFKNTPMQYTRIMNRALQDIKNNRGNPAEHVAKIVHYGGVQSLLFNGLQQALYAKLDDDDETWDEATDGVVQGMIDSYLNGMGLTGAVTVTVKNGVLEFQEQKQKGWNADHTYTILQFANLSPTIGSKLRKIYSAIKGQQINEDVIKEMELWDVQNPVWSVVANLIEGITNLPTADVIQKMNNLLAISADENEWWQNLSLLLGWNTWDVDVDKPQSVQEAKEKVEERKKEESKQKAKKKIEEKKKESQKVIDEEVEEEKKENKDVNQCGAPKSDGSRCTKAVDKPGQKCEYHASEEELKDRPRCEFIKPNNTQCKLYAVTGTEEGGKPRCNTPQHQVGYVKNKK